MRSGLLTLSCWAIFACHAFAQERIDRAKYELIRETVNFLATDQTVSEDTTFRIACETLDYGCFGEQLASNPITGIRQWYNRWRSVSATDETDLVALRDRIFADIFERPGKGYRKQMAHYEAYVTRTADLIAPPAEQLPAEVAAAEDTILESVPDRASPQAVYADPVANEIENPEEENPMIAYLAVVIGLVALALAALPLMKKKMPEQPSGSDGMEELHRRLDGIAMRMKTLERKITDPQHAEAVAHLTEIMEAVEKRVVDLENRVSE